MKIRDYLTLIGSFFQHVVKETNSYLDEISMQYEDVYSSLFQIVEENNIDNVVGKTNIRFDILRLTLQKVGDTYVPVDDVVATFAIGDPDMIIGGPDYIYGIGSAYDNSSDSSTAFNEQEYAFSTTKTVGNFLANKLIKPDVTLIKDKDYYLGPDSIIFKREALESDLFQTRKIYDSNSVETGKEIILYILDAEQENTDLYNRYGYLLDIETDDIELLKGVFRLFLLGPKITYIKAAFSLLIGLPVIIEEEETILQISTIDNKYYIVTNENTYTANSDAIIRTDIGVGTILNQFDLLFDNIVLKDTSNWWEGYDQLDVPSTVSGGDPIVVKNEIVQLMEGAGKNYPIKFGDYFDLDMFGEADKDKFYFKFGMKDLGGKTIKFGDVRKDMVLNKRDYFFGFIWRNSLYFFQVNRAGITNDQLELLSKQFDKIMPKHTYPLYYIWTDVPSEGPVMSDVANDLDPDKTRTVPRWDLVADDGVQSDQWNDKVRSHTPVLSDGYFGILTIGAFKFGAPGVKIGELLMSDTPLWYIT